MDKNEERRHSGGFLKLRDTASNHSIFSNSEIGDMSENENSTKHAKNCPDR